MGRRRCCCCKKLNSFPPGDLEDPDNPWTEWPALDPEDPEDDPTLLEAGEVGAFSHVWEEENWIATINVTLNDDQCELTMGDFKVLVSRFQSTDPFAMLYTLEFETYRESNQLGCKTFQVTKGDTIDFVMSHVLTPPDAYNEEEYYCHRLDYPGGAGSYETHHRTEPLPSNDLEFKSIVGDLHVNSVLITDTGPDKPECPQIPCIAQRWCRDSGFDTIPYLVTDQTYTVSGLPELTYEFTREGTIVYHDGATSCLVDAYVYRKYTWDLSVLNGTHAVPAVTTAPGYGVLTSEQLQDRILAVTGEEVEDWCELMDTLPEWDASHSSMWIPMRCTYTAEKHYTPTGWTGNPPGCPNPTNEHSVYDELDILVHPATWMFCRLVDDYYSYTSQPPLFSTGRQYMGDEVWTRFPEPESGHNIGDFLHGELCGLTETTQNIQSQLHYIGCNSWWKVALVNCCGDPYGPPIAFNEEFTNFGSLNLELEYSGTTHGIDWEYTATHECNGFSATTTMNQTVAEWEGI